MIDVVDLEVWKAGEDYPFSVDFDETDDGEIDAGHIWLVIKDHRYRLDVDGVRVLLYLLLAPANVMFDAEDRAIVRKIFMELLAPEEGTA